jgi:ATP-dependent exoDNAse (exonuclease V) beta subunit
VRRICWQSHAIPINRGTRRLLYVACTRAQSLLYLSHVSKRQVGGETKPKDISEFISAATKEHSVGVFRALHSSSSLIVTFRRTYSRRARHSSRHQRGP